MNANRSPFGLVPASWMALAIAFFCMATQGCVTLPTGQNPIKSGKKGKGDCCEGCEKDKAQRKPQASLPATLQPQVTQRKVLPDEINSGNYQKMLKNLEEEVDQGAVQP